MVTFDLCMSTRIMLHVMIIAGSDALPKALGMPCCVFEPAAYCHDGITRVFKQVVIMSLCGMGCIF